MEEKINIKLSNESDGKMGQNLKINNAAPKQVKDEKEFFNTTQNSE